MLGAAATAGAMAGIANGQSGYSDGFNFGYSNGVGGSFSDSEGSSWENGFSNSWGSSAQDSWGSSINDNWSSAEGSSWGYNAGENFGNSWNNGASSNAVYGSEASAKDILRAAEANALQEKWNREQMIYNAQEAEKARAFEEMMSNTSYQRAVRDLKAAGLNPILAAMNMGASTPAAVAASSGLASASKAQTYADQRGTSYNRGGSNNYGYSKGANGSNYSSKSEGHGRSYNESHGWSNQGSHSENHGGSSNRSHSESNEKSGSLNYGKTKSQTTNNLMRAIEGIGDFFSGITSAAKGANFGQGKWDGYDNPTVSN